MAESGREFKRVGSRWVLRKLYQRGESQFWYGHVRDERTGKVFWRSTGEKTKRRAEQAMLSWIRELEQKEKDKEDGTAGILFESAFDEFLGLKQVRERTLDDYSRTFHSVFSPEFGQKFVVEIELGDIERFLKRLEAVRKVKPRTRQKYLTELRSFFRWAQRHKYCVVDPTSGIKISKIPKKTGIALDVNQAKALLRACKEPIITLVEYPNRKSATQKFLPPVHLELSVLIALHTGLRRGNVTGLRWSQMDLEKRRIFIKGEEMKAHNDFECPIHPELKEVLVGILAKKQKIDPEEPVLGQELAEITKSFKSALLRAKLPDIRWHDLRHTFATWVGQRATFVVYQALMGHSAQSVSERYFHPQFDELKRVIDSLPRLLTGPTGAEQSQVSGLKA